MLKLVRIPNARNTEALLSFVPIPGPTVKRTRAIQLGDVPSPNNPPTGCHFHTHCPIRKLPLFATGKPELKEDANGHAVACSSAKLIPISPMQFWHKRCVSPSSDVKLIVAVTPATLLACRFHCRLLQSDESSLLNRSSRRHIRRRKRVLDDSLLLPRPSEIVRSD